MDRRLRRALRLARPEVREIPLPLRDRIGGDLLDQAIRRPAVSADLIGALCAPAVHELDAGALRVAVASRDLLVPLRARDVTTRGKRFDVGLAETEAPATPSTPRRPRKAYKSHRVPGDVLRQTLTIWDLLLPSLFPPLALDRDGRCDLPHSLYHYQVDGITFLKESRSALLADEMGTGKTVMSTVAMRLMFREGRVRRALVVCPLSVLGVWDRHLAEWAPELSVTVVHGDTRTRWADWRCPAHVWLVTFDTLRADVLGGSKKKEPVLPAEIARSFDLVLLDEAQNIKNADSGRTRAVLRLQPNYRWALSGTPIENRLSDLVSLFSFVRPRLLPAEDLTPALAVDLIAPYFKRRTKRDVMTELPPKIRQDEWLELDGAQRAAYAAAEDDGCRELEELGAEVTRMHVFSLLTKLKAICNFAPGAATSPKLSATVEKVEQIAASGQKVLVFSQWVGNGVDRIAQALEPFGVVRFDGGMSAPQREAAVRRFREDPSVTAFVATVKSAGVGLTLTEASYVIHFDHWWNPAWMWQAEDRAHRRGQTEPVNVYSLWMADTIEARVFEVLQKKGVLHEEVVDGLSEGAIGRLITVGEWLSVLGVRTVTKAVRGGIRAEPVEPASRRASG